MPKRPADHLRPLVIVPHVVAHPEGAALVAFGDTQVLCTASVDERVPPWLFGKGRGWVSAEYDMLPRATHTRSVRDSHKGKLNGRSQEIGRLIGRSLRAAVDLLALGERTITIDCDVLQADGGTRTAAITGGWVALALAVQTLQARKALKVTCLVRQVAAISAGLLSDGPQLDLDYAMDSRAIVDCNVVMSGDGGLIELQSTGERAPFSRAELGGMLDLAFGALPRLLEAQRRAIATPYAQRQPLVPATVPFASAEP